MGARKARARNTGPNNTGARGRTAEATSRAEADRTKATNKAGADRTVATDRPGDTRAGANRAGADRAGADRTGVTRPEAETGTTHTHTLEPTQGLTELAALGPAVLRLAQ